MFRKQRLGFTLLTIAAIFSSMACYGITQATLSPTSPSPTDLSPTSPSSTNTPAPSETPFPFATNTASSPTQSIAPTQEEPVTGQVNILQINGFTDEIDYWYFHGLVRNDTNRTIYDLQVEVKLLDSSGNAIYSYTVNSILNYLAPGETSPFSDFTADPYPEGKTMQATIELYEQAEAINRAMLQYQGITMWVGENDNIYLAGEIMNSNPVPVEIYAIAGSLVDETGTFVTASYAYPHPGYLEPDESGPFVMMFEAPVGEAGSLSDYTLYSDVWTTIPLTKFNISLSDIQNGYQDIHGDFHLPGLVTNNHSKPLNIHLIVGAYDASGNCLDANSLYLPLQLNPGETLPYDFTLWGALDYVSKAFKAVSEYKISVDWLSTYEASSPAFILPTQEDTQSFFQNSAVFNGTVVNNSGQDLFTTLVHVALYDKSSKELIATTYAFVPDQIPNNGKASYEVSLYPPIGIDPQNMDITITAIGQ